MKWTALVLAGSLDIASLLFGCARVVPARVGSDHPASPNAASASLPAPSQTLAITSSRPTPDPAGNAGVTASGDDEMADHTVQRADVSAPRATEPSPMTSPTTRPAVGGAYACPMHAEVVSDDAEARCPKCRMKLVPKEGGQ